MTFVFSNRSDRRLETCHVQLQKLFNEVIKHWDCTILVGHRNEEDQTEALRLNRTTKAWPDSNHNTSPSLAVDVAPYPIDWEDAERFRAFGGFVLGVAVMMGISIRWGGDWDGDHEFRDQRLIDMPHFELVMS